MPTAYILVGAPASGKSTWIATYPFDWNKTVIASTDNFIDREADKLGKTYSDVFKDAMPAAISYMANTVKEAVRQKMDIVWDQTSMTAAARAKKLRMLTPDYKTIAVVFKTPNKAEHDRRLNSRPGKIIPNHVLTNMQQGYERPTTDEGFDEIWDI